MTQAVAEIAAEECKLVTLRVGKQLLGIPVTHVRDVLKNARIAPVPLASAEVLGAMNLRGRVVTVVDMRIRLHLGPMPEDVAPMFIVTECRGEYFGLRVDAIGEVLTLTAVDIEKKPANLKSPWRDVASGIYRLPEELLVVVDLEALLATGHNEEKG
ncbi:MAG: chemotaxis protein CheW [Pseudomonadota bacterium]|nr:chemotaxis protein CheW [Pseudomonadota bacterium]